MMSVSPSSSMSPTRTSSAWVASVVRTTSVKVGSAAPSFSYHAILSSPWLADRMSRCPSLLTSPATTVRAPSAVVEMTISVNVGSAAPSFSCQAIVSAPCVADKTSMSPSSSTSAAKTEVAPLEVAHTSCGMKMISCVSSSIWSVCSYQAIPQFSSTGVAVPTTGSARREAASTSVSPSPSTSAANTDAAPRAPVVMTRMTNDGGLPPTFSCQAIVWSRKDAESTSRSPSPSTSATKLESGSAVSRVTVRGLKIGETPSACSYQNTPSRSREEPTRSTSPSPSRSPE